MKETETRVTARWCKGPSNDAGEPKQKGRHREEEATNERPVKWPNEPTTWGRPNFPPGIPHQNPCKWINMLN